MKVNDELVMTLSKSGEFIVSASHIYQMSVADLERDLQPVVQFLAHCSSLIEAKKKLALQNTAKQKPRIKAAAKKENKDGN